MSLHLSRFKHRSRASITSFRRDAACIVLVLAMAAFNQPVSAAQDGPAQEPAEVSAKRSAAASQESTSLEQGIEVLRAGLQAVAGRDDYWLNADLSVMLNPTLSDAVNRGLSLYFVLDAELIKPRWYWLDERVVTKSRFYRLHYHALTREYRLQSASLPQSLSPGFSLGNPSSWLAPLGLASGPASSTNQSPGAAGFYQPFGSLQEALSAMGRLRAWPLIENTRLPAGQGYELRLRMRLDASQLPRPLQIPGISQKDWSIEGAWKRFPLEIGTKKNAP